MLCDSLEPETVGKAQLDIARGTRARNQTEWSTQFFCIADWSWWKSQLFKAADFRVA